MEVIVKKDKLKLIFILILDTDSAPLAVTPRPDSVLRVFMAYRPLNAPVSVPPQELTPFVHRNFTLVEWGGQGPDEADR